MRWLASSVLPLAALAARLGTPAADPPEAPSGFVGAARCAECHQRLNERWAGARHGKMLQPATPAAVEGDFARGAIELRGKRYGLRRKAGAYFITESYLDGRERERRVDYTLGSRRIQHYLTTLEDGRIVVLPPSWDVARQQWFHNLEIVDPEETAATKVQVWNTNCFGCHVSGEQKNYDPAHKTYATRWADFGTNCERCHGAGAAHVEWHAANDGAHAGAAPAAAAMVRPTRLGPERETMVCAQCHSLRDVTAAGFTAGQDYYDHFMPVLEYAQKIDHDPAYWADGRPRRFSNDAMGFWQSRCHLQGGATCTTCHVDPHEPDVDRNPQLRPEDNALCTRCHEEIGRRVAEHSRHPAGPGRSCVECHMPTTVVSIKTRIRDHTIGVPAPENTARFGIPNACNECHRDRSPEWAVQALAGWGGERRERVVRRAAAFAGGRQADPAALAPLLALAADPAEPSLVRANALGHLRRYRDGRVTSALTSAMMAKEPVMRAVAALTLADLPLTDEARSTLVRALSDERRVVRVGVAFALANHGVARLGGEDGERLERARAEYVERGALLTDDVETQLNLGKFHFLGRDYGRAGRAFEDALRLDPAAAGGRYFLGLTRIGERRVAEGRSLLRQVGRGDPYFAAARTMLEKLDVKPPEGQ